MKKRVVASLLAVGMLLSCLSGCGQKEQESSQQKESSSVEQSSKSTEQSSVQESTQQKEQEVEKVIWALRCDPQEDDEKVVAAMNEILRERYNLELEIITIPSGEYNDRMRLMITSEEEFDLCFTASYANKFSDNVTMGAFLGLNDLLQTEAAADLMEVYPIDITGVSTVDGEIYALPNLQMLCNQEAFYIQKELAEKYDLPYKSGDRVESVNDPELKAFMDKIRDNEPDYYVFDEDGQRKETIGTNGKFYDTITSILYVDYEDDTFTVRTKLEDPKYIENLREMNQLYKDGYVREDVATTVDNSADQKTNRYAIMTNTGKPGGDAETSNKYGKEYIMVYCGEPTMASNAGISTMTAINVNSKNPEAAIKMYGVFWTDPEIYNMFLFGLEGEHYTKVGENRVELISGSGYDRSGFGWAVGNQFNAWLLPGQADDVWEVSAAMNESAEVSHLAGFTFNSVPVETELAQLKTVASEYYEQFMYVEDFDGWVETALAKYKASGLDNVVKEAQAQIDAWRAANGK